MRKLHSIFIAIAVFGLVNTGFANTPKLLGDNNSTVHFYVGAQPGYVNTGYSRDWLKKEYHYTSTGSVDNSGFGARFLVGCDFNRYLALEMSYLYSPEIVFHNVNGSQISGNFRQHVVDLLGKASLPFGSKIGMFGEMGVAYLHREALKLDVNETLYTPTAAAGMYVNITPNAYVDASYHYYLKTGNFKAIQFLGLSLVYKM